MISTGLLPLMALNLSKTGPGTLFVMDDSISPDQMIQKLDNKDDSLDAYALSNKIYYASATATYTMEGNVVSLILNTPIAKYAGTVGKEFNQSFTGLNTPLTNTDTATKADFPDVLIYVPKNVVTDVYTYSSSSQSLSIPLSVIGLNPEKENDFGSTYAQHAALLLPNIEDSTNAFTIATSYDAWRQSRGAIMEVNYSEAITPDVMIFKCLIQTGASYRPAWSSWRLLLYYYNESNSTWVAVPGAYICGPYMIAHTITGVTAKRFRVCVSGSFEGTSGSFNTGTALGLSKFALGKKNTPTTEATYQPRTAVFFPYNAVVEQAGYGKLYPVSNSKNAVVFNLGGYTAPISTLNNPDAFEDGSTLATFPVDSNLNSTYKPVYASSLVDMENALTYVANNNYLGRKVINNDGAFSGHGPLNGAFSATMNAGAGRKWAIKDVVIKDNAVAVPTYPNNPTIRWYGSNDNITYDLLFTAPAATGQRIINLPSEVYYQYLKIEHDTQPSNNYALSAGVYTDNSVVMKSIVTGTAVGTTSYVPGVFGNAVQGNGSYYMKTDIKLGPLSSWSISCHANKLKTGTGSILGSTNATGYVPKLLLVMDNRLAVGKIILYGITSGGVVVSSTIDKLTDDDFHHIAVVYSSGVLSLYIDGVFKTSIELSLSGLTKELNFFQEGENYSFFNGAIDQIRIFKRALSAVEINQLKIESIVTEGTGTPGELAFDNAFLSGQRINLAPNSNTIGAEI